MSDEPKNLETSEAETAGVSRGRKLASGLGAVVNLALALLITVMINYLAFRHYRVFDLTSARYYELSDQTRNVLQNLQSPLQIIVLFNPESDVYDYIQTLLNEYAAQSPKRVNVLYLDSGLRTKKAEDVAKEFQVGAEENVVIFKYGSRSKFVKHDRMASDLVDYDFSEMQFTGRQRIANYRAEGAFTSAIISVIEEKQPKISFLEGHDERSLEDFRSGSGLSMLKTALTRQNLVVEPLNLVKTGRIPEDCGALVIAGPKTALSEPELALLRAYLDKKGRMLLMLDPNTKDLTSAYGFGELLAKWNVRLGADYIVNPPMLLQAGEQQALINVGEVFCADYGSHPITEKIRSLNMLFRGARSVGELASGAGADRPRVTPLIRSGKEYWGEASTMELLSGRMPHFDEGVDNKGPLTLAVAVESTSPGGNVDIGSTRLVVVGNSRCVADGEQSDANVAFFLNSINWLLERKSLLGIPPKPSRSYKLDMTPRQVQIVSLGSMLGLPLIAAMIGLLVWWRRRR